MDNSEIIHKFYKAFMAHDAETMTSYYHDDVIFEDPAFGKLKGDQAKSMWRMLISRAKGNLNVIYKDVEAQGSTGSARWIAKYGYGPNKRPVENHVSAQFEFKDGKIWRHKDTFDMWKWSRMALGVPGILLGWSPFLKNRVQKGARESLDQFIKKGDG